MKQPLPPQVIEALRGFDSPTIANAIEYFGVRDPTAGYANNELRCQTPEVVMPMVGYALTATADGTTPGDTRPSRVDECMERIAAAPKPTVLVIQHVGPDRRRACKVGDMFCTIAQRLGAVGVVTDASARDRAGIRQRTPDFHLFTTGWVVSHGYPAYLEFGTTVSICGLTIAPGDLLHGDASGLVSIPLNIAEDLVERAAAVRQEETDYFAFLESDQFSMEELKRRIVPQQFR